MPNVLTDLFDIFLGLIGTVIHNGLFIIIIALVAVVAYLYFNKPKKQDMQDIVFNKQWEATHLRQAFPSPRILSIVPYLGDKNDVKDVINTIYHQPIGNVTGVNCFPIINNLKALQQLASDPNNENLQNFINDPEIQKFIAQDKCWLGFSCQRNVGGKWLFPTIKKTMIMCKPNQIMYMNSSDNIIRVHGNGLVPVGKYEIVNDDFSSINRMQLTMDIVDTINTEVVLGAWSIMGTVAEHAMGIDSDSRKELNKESVKIQQAPEGTKSEV